MFPALGRDLVALILSDPALAPVGKGMAHTVAAFPATALVAAGEGDNVEINGTTVDTQAQEARFTGLQFVVHATATLTATKTLVLTANLQDSANGSVWADTTTPATLLTLTGGEGGTTETGVASLACDLSATRRYVRIQVTPNLSATETDTATVAGVAVYGAHDAGDATEVNGVTLDTQALASRPNSVVFVVQAKATLTQDATLTVTANLQDSADGSSWTDITTPADILTLTGGDSGTTETGTAMLGYDLSQARQYLRIQATPTLSAATTDTAILSSVVVFGGLDRI